MINVVKKAGSQAEIADDNASFARAFSFVSIQWFWPRRLFRLGVRWLSRMVSVFPSIEMLIEFGFRPSLHLAAPVTSGWAVTYTVSTQCSQLLAPGQALRFLIVSRRKSRAR